MAKKSAAAARPPKQTAKPEAPAPVQAMSVVEKFEIDLSPSPESARGASVVQYAKDLVINDKASHKQGREYATDLKDSIKNIKAFHTRTKRGIDRLKQEALDNEKTDIAPFEEALGIISGKVIQHENDEQARVDAENERIRLKDEKDAQEKRDLELAEQEAAALKLEESSNDMSAREQAFLDAYVTSARPEVERGEIAAKIAGFKNPREAAHRLLKTEKIVVAVEAIRQAAVIRQQALVRKDMPLEVKPTQAVEKQVAKTGRAHTQTYYSCEEKVDEEKLWASVLAGTTPRSAFMVNKVALNSAADALKELFPQAYPGCALKKRQGLVG